MRTKFSLRPHRATYIYPLVVAALYLASTATALASNGGGQAGTLPWDNTLGALTGILSGSIAKYISIVAIFVAGLALIFGEDLGAFAKRLLMIVIAIAFLVGASSIATSFVGSASGALV